MSAWDRMELSSRRDGVALRVWGSWVERRDKNAPELKLHAIIMFIELTGKVKDCDWAMWCTFSAVCSLQEEAEISPPIPAANWSPWVAGRQREHGRRSVAWYSRLPGYMTQPWFFPEKVSVWRPPFFSNRTLTSCATLARVLNFEWFHRLIRSTPASIHSKSPN